MPDVIMLKIVHHAIFAGILSSEECLKVKDNFETHPLTLNYYMIKNR